MRKTYRYTEEDLILAVKESKNYCEVCRKLGIKNTGGNSYERVRNHIHNLNLDVSHFRKSGFSLGGIYFKKRKTAGEFLTQNQPNRVSHSLLKRSLIEIGREYKCEEKDCGINEWKGKPITLDIDHKDGDWSNCSPENLRFLCPNCHRQTKTFAGRNIKLKYNGDLQVR